MTSTNSTPARSLCVTCGAPLVPGPLEGHCPNCLLHVSIETLAPELLSQDGGPTHLGDYELLSEIARGGSGVVYRARQSSLGGRTVAVKVLAAGEFASEEVRRRFRGEAEAAARLQHPGIVAIHEVGESDGLSWFSMEYVPGGTLADFVREHPMPSRAAAQHVRGIAVAVQYAHECGILHRDLKPSNILLDPSGQPKITDFGVARRSDLAETLTVTGAVVGSPGYMAPEQAFAEKAAVGPATDVYGLGALLYHLLTGRPPFQGPTLDAILLQLAESEPVSPRRLNPSVPRDLETICLRCLHKSPERRYPTAADVAEDLARFLEGRPIRARPVSWHEKAWRWCRRRPALAAMLALAAALAGTSAILNHSAGLSEQRRAQAAEKLAREQQRHALIARAELRLHSHEMGRRGEVLKWLRDAWALGPSVEIRNSAIAALTLLDAEWHPLPEGIEWLESPVAPQVQLPTNTTITMSAFDPGANRVAAAGDDTLVYILDSKRGTVIHRLRAHEGPLLSLAFSPDGHWLATASADESVRLWNVRTGEEVLVIEQSRYPEPPQLRWSSDGAWLATTAGRALRIIRPSFLQQFDIESEEMRMEGIRTIDLSSDGRWLVTVGEAGTRLWDTETQREVALFPKLDAEWSGARFSPNNRRLWIGGWNSALRAVDLPQEIPGQLGQPEFVSEFSGALIEQSPDGAFLIALNNDRGGFQFVPAQGGNGNTQIWLPQPHPFRVALDTEMTLAATSSYDAEGVQLWDFSRRARLRTIPAPGAAKLAFAAKGAYLITAPGKTLAIWNTATGERHDQRELPATIRSIATSPEGQILAVETRSGIALYAARPPLAEFTTLNTAPPNTPASFCFSPDGAQLAVQIDSGGAIVWHLEKLRNELKSLGMAWD